MSFLAVAQTLTLDELLETAFSRNLTLSLEKENIKQKEISLQTANKLRWPTLNASTSVTNTSTTNDLTNQSGSASMSIRQPIYQGGSISIQQNIANFEYQKTSLSFLRKKQSLRKDIQLAYIDLLQAIAREKEDQLSLSRLREQNRISKILYSEGDVWKNDVLQAEVSIAQGESRLIATQNKILLAKSSINILINFDLDSQIDVRGELTWRDYEISWPEIKNKIEAHHPEIKSAKIDEFLSKLRLLLVKTTNIPTVALSSSVSRSERFTPNIPGSNSMKITLSASWKIWDRGNNSRDVHRARIDKRKQSINLFNKRQTLLKKAQKSWLNLQESASQVRLLKQSIGIAQENYRVNTVRYQEKLGTANELLSAQTLLSKSKNDWLSALARYLKTLYTLEYNLGTGFK